MNQKEIKEHNIYKFQSIADKEPEKVKIIQVVVHKKKIRVEISRDLINELNPFWVDPSEIINP